jgi:hypothetical protein
MRKRERGEYVIQVSQKEIPQLITKESIQKSHFPSPSQLEMSKPLIHQPQSQITMLVYLHCAHAPVALSPLHRGIRVGTAVFISWIFPSGFDALLKHMNGIP